MGVVRCCVGIGGALTILKGCAVLFGVLGENERG